MQPDAHWTQTSTQTFSMSFQNSCHSCKHLLWSGFSEQSRRPHPSCWIEPVSYEPHLAALAQEVLSPAGEPEVCGAHGPSPSSGNVLLLGFMGLGEATAAAGTLPVQV